MAGRLILVATPIGNLEDLTPRSAKALGEADFWLVEDTRVSGKLAAHLGVRKPMRVLNEHTAEAKLGSYAGEIESGQTAVLLTDAGTPGISDPGALFVQRCLEESIEIDALPGPSAVTTALSISGFFAQQFVFLGFLPRKAGPLKAEFAPFQESTLTIAYFDSPFRVVQSLEVISEVLGTRRYAICRELTKMHQQIFRSELPTLPTESEMPRKGEFTVVIEGFRRKNFVSNG